MRRTSISAPIRSRGSGKRASASAERDAAILKAALEEFTSKGFAAVRMEDIAHRAAVAKGTIYLRFRDKEALFEAIIRQQVFPLVEAVNRDIEPGESIRGFLGRTMAPFLHDLAGSPRAAVVRLLIAEAGRFPNLAELYFRMVIEPALERFEVLMRRAARTKELSNPKVAHFPQVLIAPVVVGVLWSGLFRRFRPLDVEAMVRAHLDSLFPAKKLPAKPLSSASQP